MRSPHPCRQLFERAFGGKKEGQVTVEATVPACAFQTIPSPDDPHEKAEPVTVTLLRRGPQQ